MVEQLDKDTPESLVAIIARRLFRRAIFFAFHLSGCSGRRKRQLCRFRSSISSRSNTSDLSSKIFPLVGLGLRKLRKPAALLSDGAAFAKRKATIVLVCVSPPRRLPNTYTNQYQLQCVRRMNEHFVLGMTRREPGIFEEESRCENGCG